ncbi:MAG: hypothetical protein JXX14_08840 [Deltaproteobacteria bacterium]|nr:hypothetical protein [Deltaproteobacteria bacterium]
MKLRLAIILVAAIMGTQVLGEDYSWVETDELKLELNARRNDLQRTEGRIAELSGQLLAQQNEKQNIEAELAQVEARLIQRTSMLYRLSKNGKSVQYLFSSDSMISFIKRMQTLKLLVTSQMDEKREVTMRLTRVDDEIQRTMGQLQGARNLAAQLTEMTQNLQSELAARPDAGGR